MPSSNTPVPVRVEPAARTPEEWRRYHAFRRAYHLEFQADDPYHPDDVVEARELKGYPFDVVESYEVIDGGAVVAAGGFVAPKPGSPGYESNRDFCQGWLGVLGSHRRQGIARAFLPLAADFARRHGSRMFSVGAHQDAGHATALHYGFKKTFEGHDNRLDLNGLDWSMVESWAEAGRRRSPARSLELIEGRIPEEQLDQYCREVTELENLVPWEDEEHGEIVRSPEKMRHWWELNDLAGDLMYTLLAREPDGRITGITEVVLLGRNTEHLWQELTAVHPSIQGHGVGRWLKAAMLLHVRSCDPRRRWVMTGNAGSNGPMLKINHELGFRLHRVNVGYQIPVDALVAVAEARSDPRTQQAGGPELSAPGASTKPS